MLKTLRFEPIDESHIPRILEIEQKTNGAPWSELSFRNELANPHGIFKVALLGGELIGYGGIWLVIDEAHVTTLSISEDNRRQGIGRKLMVDLLVEAKKRGMTCSTLEVRAGNMPAIRLYEQLGFAETARRRAYYPDNREDAIVMWLYELDKWEPTPWRA
ncbi:MAG: ribosomal protein S18-alanine N-acetyltransferase [Fimbriimonas sp.]